MIRLVRSDCRWLVVKPELVLDGSLEEIALKTGYRVSAVSHELRVTEQHFRIIFRRDVGIPVKVWMRSERMVVARRMLAGGIPPADLPALLGFSHLNSFRREFCEVYGITPAKWTMRSRTGAFRDVEII